MGLVGSLEDLALPELLQIIGLSNKSGVLILNRAEGEGRIVLKDGLVRGAVVPGGPTDLRGVLVDGEIVSKEDFDSAEAEASGGDEDIRAILIQREIITQERLETVCGDAVEHSVIKLLGWESGEFSLEVRDADEPEDPKVRTATGLNPQYLMMEASRLSDEAGSGPASDELEEADDAEGPPTQEMKHPALPDPVPVPVPEESQQTSETIPAPVASTATAATPPPAKTPVVVIDSNPDALEWTKKSLSGVFPRVHVFQHPDQALSRIRQYLGGGKLPLVLVSCDDGAANASKGIGDPRVLVGRLKAQAARAPVLWLAEAEAPAPESISPADGLVTRPTLNELSGPGAAARNEPLAEQLRTDLLACLARSAAAGGNNRRGSLGFVKDATTRLTEASKKGEVLPLLIRLAGGMFSRVAMFSVQDGLVIGLAQSGLAKTGGPDDTGLRDIELQADESAWLRAVLAGTTSVRGSPSDDGDLKLARLLGSSLPGEAYLAPIQTGGETVALIYADNLPHGGPIGDTAALEVLLNHAGVVLDREALRRAVDEG